VILRVDSPGGGVGPSQEIHREVLRLKEKKPVVVSMGAVAASGGYYVSCAADKIIANEGTITGSIGVIMEFLNVERLFEWAGLKSRVIKSGKYKDIGSGTREMTDEEKKLLQAMVDDVHDQFVSAIVESRGIERATVLSFADGRVFSGRQAKEIGLVDELGNFRDAVAKAAELAGIEGDPKLVYPRRRGNGPFDRFFTEMFRAMLRSAEELERPVELRY
jgi:protease IV